MKHFFFPSDCICFLNIVFPYISWRQNKRLKIRALIFFFSHLLSCWQFSETSPLGRINRSGLCTPQHFAQTVNTTLTTLCYCQVFSASFLGRIMSSSKTSCSPYRQEHLKGYLAQGRHLVTAEFTWAGPEGKRCSQLPSTDIPQLEED